MENVPALAMAGVCQMPTIEREFSNTRIFADGENSSFENGQENAQARSGCGYAFESTVSATDAFEEQPNTNGREGGRVEQVTNAAYVRGDLTPPSTKVSGLVVRSRGSLLARKSSTL